ncbi:hypothetical protein J3P97_13270 [Pseudomonas sp. R1-15]
MYNTWQTEPLYTGAQGFEAWQHDLGQKCGTFHAEPPSGPGLASFTGAMKNLTGTDSALDGSRIISNCQHLHRARSDIRADDKDFFYLVLQVGGSALMCQADNRARLDKGDLVLLDITQPCDFLLRCPERPDVADHSPPSAAPTLGAEAIDIQPSLGCQQRFGGHGRPDDPTAIRFFEPATARECGIVRRIADAVAPWGEQCNRGRRLQRPGAETDQGKNPDRTASLR